MNQVDERVESIEHLKFKPSCTFRVGGPGTPECGKDAVWASEGACCGTVRLQCAGHANGGGGTIVCTDCGIGFPSFREWVSRQWRL